MKPRRISRATALALGFESAQEPAKSRSGASAGKVATRASAGRNGRKRAQMGKVSGHPEPTEHQEQAAFFDFARPYLQSKGIDPRLCFAIPNAQKFMSLARNPYAAYAVAKSEGLVEGVPDLMLAWPKWSTSSPLVCSFHGLLIEMKRETGKPKPEQLEMATLLRQAGYSVVIALGSKEAIRAIKAYVET